MKQSCRPLLCALAVLAFFFLVGIASAQAQTVTPQPSLPRGENPLFANTGANVLPSGGIQLDGGFGFRHIGVDLDYGAYGRTHIFDRSLLPGARLRVGLGIGIEVAVALQASFASGENEIIHPIEQASGWITLDTFAADYRSVTVAPTIEARAQLFAGRGWLPQVTFVTSLAMPMYHSTYFSSTPEPGDHHELSPTVGLQLRNRLGNRWVLDYSLAYGWNHRYREGVGDADWLFSLGARWLATDRLMLGASVENYGGRLEASYQASPTLQLTASADCHQGYDLYEGHRSCSARLGLAWRIK